MRAMRSAVLSVAATLALGGCGPEPVTVTPPVVIQPPTGVDLDPEGLDASNAPMLVFVVGVLAWATIVLVRRARRRRSPGEERRDASDPAPESPHSGRFRLTTSRRTQLLVRHGPRAEPNSPGENSDAARHFPAWGSENRLIETIQRIANDPTAYSCKALPTGPGVYVAKARMSDPAGDKVVVKVVVDAGTRDVLAAFPSAGAPGAAASAPPPDGPFAEIHDLLARALDSLPAAAATCATRNPRHPDSVGTLALARELLAQGEWEACLYAVTTIVRAIGGWAEGDALLAQAARALQFDADQRARAGLV